MLRTLCREATLFHDRSTEERSKLLRKTVYQFDEEFKTKMPSKNLENDLNKELDYCKKLEKIIENAPSINEIPSVKRN
ncbi:hypothetical protein MASR1M29_09210 [Cloacibacterium normanense]